MRHQHVKHKDEYHARLWYEENRWRRKPRIWFLRSIPSPFIWGDGSVDYCTVHFNEPRVFRYKYQGEPRWTEWGTDIKHTVVHRASFSREQMTFYSGVTGNRTTFAVYVEGGSNYWKARAMMSRMLLRM